jgi:hypothetical protein
MGYHDEYLAEVARHDNTRWELQAARAEIADLRARILTMTDVAQSANRDADAALRRERSLEAAFDRAALAVTGRPYAEVADTIVVDDPDAPTLWDPESAWTWYREISSQTFGDQMTLWDSLGSKSGPCYRMPTQVETSQARQRIREALSTRTPKKET